MMSKWVYSESYNHFDLCSEWLCDVETEHREELEQSVNQVIFEWIEKYNYQPNWFEIDHITLVTNKGGD